MKKIPHLNNTIGKRCLVALSYFDAQEQILKQSLLAGKVIAINKEQGITFALFSGEQINTKQTANIIIPADLSCWFTAPKGDFHTSQAGIKITDPDFLVTWDIYQKNDDKKEGEQQWWQWLPRTAAPIVNK